MSSLKDTINKISILSDKLSTANLSLEEKSSIQNELLQLFDKASKLQHLDFLDSHQCIIRNNEISLYLDDSNSIQKYIISDSLSNDYIGEILYNTSSKEDIQKYGNISYYICHEKRGHHYALKALNLLTDSLYEKGVQEIYIAAKSNNISSIKTIESFGGKLTVFSTNNIHVYSCDLKTIKNKYLKNKSPH